MTRHIVRARHELPHEPGSLTQASGALVFELGETHYRRSEDPWSMADAPTATVAVAASWFDIVVDVEVRKASPPAFAPSRDENELDNEHPDINSDGLQLRISTESGEPSFCWLLVPDPAGVTVRVTPRHHAGSSPGAIVQASWRAIDGGYAVRCRLPRHGLGIDDAAFMLEVVVNEISAGRERRRGQLVLSGGGGEWVYLRGDREDAARALHFTIVNG